MYRDKNGEWEIENFKIIESKEPADIVTLYEDIYGFIWVGSLGEECIDSTQQQVK